MRNNGRWTATEEAIALGGGDLFQIADSVSRHRDIDFPVTSTHPCMMFQNRAGVRKHLLDLG